MLPLSKQRANKNSGLMIAFWLSKLLLRKNGIRWKKKLSENRKSMQNCKRTAKLFTQLLRQEGKNCIWFSKMSDFLGYFRQSRYVYSRWTKKKLKCNATKLISPHIYPSLKESRAHLLVTKSIAIMKKSSLAICQILKQYLLIFSEV